MQVRQAIHAAEAQVQILTQALDNAHAELAQADDQGGKQNAVAVDLRRRLAQITGLPQLGGERPPGCE